jgi:predicted glutamine amidotransferase
MWGRARRSRSRCIANGDERRSGRPARAEPANRRAHARLLDSDGERLWAVRYSSQHRSRTLFVSEDVDALRQLHPENERLQRLSEGDRVVVSEPLADLSGAWFEVPESTALALEDGVLSQRPFRPR